MLLFDCCLVFFFFFNDTATTEIYTLSLHDALPISGEALTVKTEAEAPFLEHAVDQRSEEHTSELRHTIISYAVFCLKKKKKKHNKPHPPTTRTHRNTTQRHA